MKKIVGLVLVLAFVAALSGSALAAKTIVGNQAYTGVANFANSGNIDVSFKLFNVSDDTTATQINWTSSEAFNTGSTNKWVMADQYAVVAATVTASGFRNLSIYTENTVQQDNNYVATSSRAVYGTGGNLTGYSYSGLVGVSANQGTGDSGFIPVVFAFSAEKNNAGTSTYDPDTTNTVWGADIIKRTASGSYVSEKSDQTSYNLATSKVVRVNKGLIDKADKKADGTSNFEATYTVIAYSGGPAFGYSNNVDGYTGYWGSDTIVDNTAYMYFFGNFKNIVGGDVYGSDKITVALDAE